MVDILLVLTYDTNSYLQLLIFYNLARTYLCLSGWGGENAIELQVYCNLNCILSETSPNIKIHLMNNWSSEFSRQTRNPKNTEPIYIFLHLYWVIKNFQSLNFHKISYVRNSSSWLSVYTYGELFYFYSTVF